MPQIKTILKECSRAKGQEQKEIKVIAATGGGLATVINEYFEWIDDPGSLCFQVLLIDPKLSIFDRAASHWRDECRYYTDKCLPDLNRRFNNLGVNIRIEWRTYDFFPCIHGYLFGEKYLLIGWCQWVDVGDRKELRGAEKPYLYFETGSEIGDYFVSLFKNWFDYAWEPTAKVEDYTKMEFGYRIEMSGLQNE